MAREGGGRPGGRVLLCASSECMVISSEEVMECEQFIQSRTSHLKTLRSVPLNTVRSSPPVTTTLNSQHTVTACFKSSQEHRFILGGIIQEKSLNALHLPNLPLSV